MTMPKEGTAVPPAAPFPPALEAYGPLVSVTSRPRVTTFRGVDPRSGAPVFLKILGDPSESALGRDPGGLQRATTYLKSLKDAEGVPVPKLLEIGRIGHDAIYFVTPWLDLRPLQQGVDPIEVVRVAHATSAGLETLSRYGLAHLNLRPENVLVDGTGEVCWTGLATGFVVDGVGDPHRAPELATQLAAGGPLWRCDAYSLASTVCELLGVEVSDRGSQEPLLLMPAGLTQQLRGSEGLRHVLESALHRATTRRPASWSVVRRALENCLDDNVEELPYAERRRSEESSAQGPPSGENPVLVFESGTVDAGDVHERLTLVAEPETVRNESQQTEGEVATEPESVEEDQDARDEKETKMTEPARMPEDELPEDTLEAIDTPPDAPTTDGPRPAAGPLIARRAEMVFGRDLVPEELLDGAAVAAGDPIAEDAPRPDAVDSLQTAVFSIELDEGGLVSAESGELSLVDGTRRPVGQVPESTDLLSPLPAEVTPEAGEEADVEVLDPLLGSDDALDEGWEMNDEEPEPPVQLPYAGAARVERSASSPLQGLLVRGLLVVATVLWLTFGVLWLRQNWGSAGSAAAPPAAELVSADADADAEAAASRVASGEVAAVAEAPERSVAPAEAPEPAPQVVAAPVPVPEDDIAGAVDAWAKAWSAQNVEGYLAAYAADFRPANGVSRSRWAATRRERVAAPARISVEVSELEVALKEDTARASFVQSYSSDTMSDRVRKTLTLVREGDAWKIAGETSAPLP